MKQVVNNSMVAHLWAHQTQESARNSGFSFSFYGPELRSYGTTVAWHFGDLVVMADRSFSVTTSGQMAGARLSTYHLRQIYADVFSYGRIYSSAPKGDKIVDALTDKLYTLMESLPRRRSEYAKEYNARAVTNTVGDINFIIERFNLKRDKVTMPDNIQDMIDSSKEALERIRAEKAEAIRKQERRAKRKHAKDLKAWRKGEIVYLPRALSTVDGGQMLTIRGDVVITSMNAEAPVEHVRKALRFYESRRDGKTFKAWEKNGHQIRVGVFHIDRIEKDGTVKAGCHTFTHNEIKRFVKQWNEVLAA